MKRGYEETHDVHAGGGGVEDMSAEAAVAEDFYGRVTDELDPMEIWLENVDEEQQQLHVDDFAPLLAPEFPCMSSSSSTSSAPVGGLAKPTSSSTASSSSSSAASWAVLKSDAEEDPRKIHLATPSEHSAPLEESFTDEDCINVMENLGYMDFITGDDIWDPCSIFQTENNKESDLHHAEDRSGGVVGVEVVPQQAPLPGAIKAAENPEMPLGNSELAVIFFEWLKRNKDDISIEDMRSIKLKRSTIESASKRLGNSKEGKKQLLKLILEWVQQYQLQKKKNAAVTASASAANSDHYQLETYPSGNSNFPVDSTAPPPPPPCFYPPQWTPAPPPPPPPYIHDPMMAAPPPFPIFQPPIMATGYNNVDSYFPPHPIDYHPSMDSAQSWPSEFTAASSHPFIPYDSEANRVPAPESAQPVYGGEYPYQLFDGKGERLVRLASSATKEARKKRMARQRRFSNHHFRHQNHHNSSDVHHANAVRMSAENCALPHHPHVNGLGSWIFWSQSASDAPPPTVMAPPPAVETSAPQPPSSERPPQQNYQKQQGPSDRRQGFKAEKNLKFLLQKVLKQSDVGSLGRIVLPKKEAETQLPELDSRDGITISMEDIGTSRVWNMKYRFWPNNKSRMYLLENTGDFVRTNGLQEGDFIVIYADTKCGKYMIRGVKVRQGQKQEVKKPARKNPRTVPSSPATSHLSLIKQTVN